MTARFPRVPFYGPSVATLLIGALAFLAFLVVMANTHAAEPNRTVPPAVSSRVEAPPADLTFAGLAQRQRAPVCFDGLCGRRVPTATVTPPATTATTPRVPPAAVTPPATATGPVKPAAAALTRTAKPVTQFVWQQVCGRRGCTWQLVPAP